MSTTTTTKKNAPSSNFVSSTRIRRHHDHQYYFGQSSFTLANDNNQAAASASTTTINNTREVTTASIAVNKQQKLDNLRPISESNRSSESNSNRSCHRVDIVLNCNAKGVTSKIIQLVQQVVSSYTSSSQYNNNTKTNVNIHVTSTIDEATIAVASMIHNPPSLIIAVGGDGTITTLLQLLWDIGMDTTTSSASCNCNECSPTMTMMTNTETESAADDATRTAKRQRRRKFPPIGYIAHGTGNALGSVIGARPPSVVAHEVGSSNRILQRLRSRIVGGRGGEVRLRETLHQLLHTVDQLSHHEHQTVHNIFDIVELPMIQVTTTTSIVNDEEEYEQPLKTEKQQQQQQQQRQQQRQLPNNEKFNRRSELCFFSGVGFDSLLLQDYKYLQHWTNSSSSSSSSSSNNESNNDNKEATTRQRRRRRLPNLRKLLFRDSLSSVFGYFVAFLTCTLPNCIMNQKHIIHVKVQTSDIDNTVWIDHRRGDLVRKVIVEKKDDDKEDGLVLLYQGNAGIVAASSTPYYGGGLRLFPFARMTLNGMQLRIGRIHPLRGTMNLIPIFHGSYRDKRDDTFGCLDFMGQQFQIDILLPTIGYPVQHSGDFVGIATCIEYEMMKDRLHPIQFVTLLPPRLIC